MRITYPLRAIYWHIHVFFLALRWVRGLNIGDRVVTKYGQEWTLVQGVCRPSWELQRGDHASGTQRIECNECDFRKVRSLSNYFGSFQSGWCFYMSTWYAIWVNQGIQPWMRQLNIWGRRQPTKHRRAG